MQITTILLLIMLHFVADFVLQSTKVATTKSKSNSVLLWHVTLYGMTFIWFGWQYALLNAALHFVVDWNTSRITSFFWEKKNMRAFFTVIGLDQALHMMCLVITHAWLIK